MTALEAGKGAAEDFVLVLSPFSASITVKIQVLSSEDLYYITTLIWATDLIHIPNNWKTSEALPEDFEISLLHGKQYQ